jgi:signal transduction histidine kinase
VKFWNSQSISGKLMRMTLLVSGTALLLAYISFLGYDLYTFRQNLINALATEADIIGANSVAALLFNDSQAAETTLSALQSSPQIRSAIIVRADGAVFAHYARDRTGQLDISERLGAGDARRYWTKGRDVVLGSRISFQGKPVGTVYLRAEMSDLARRAGRFGLISACMLLICFAVALLATSTIRHLVTDPLSGLARTAQIVSRDKDYSVRAKLPRTSDELSQLVGSFNEMLEQIQQRDKALEESRSVLEQRVQERTAELSAANKELEAFSYSVAHDLRGPLQHINNIGFLLQQSYAQQLSTEGRSLVGNLLEASRRMSSLIEDLLNLSQASSQPLRRTPINLSYMAETILAELNAQKDGRRAESKVEQGAHVIADEGLLRVVLENLINNSWKYTSKVDSALIEFGYTDEPIGTVYFVRDNGVGFNPRYADRLFRPFQRLHSQSDFPGTGVGLATAYRIIARHGGKIWAKGNVNQGATFFFTLPYEAND